jgi:biopolymer transport protein ExbB
MKELYRFVFVQGGPVMYPIVAGSVLALAIFLERLWSLRRERVLPSGFRDRLRALVKSGKVSEAEVLCQENQSPLANVVAAGLRRAGLPREQVKEAIMEVGRREVVYLEKRVDLLGTVAAVEPLMGLLGTVTGLIQAFRQVQALSARGGAVNPGALAGGIWEALITTAGGLMIGIPAYIGYRYLQSHVDHVVVEIEEESLEVADMLAARAAPPETRP